MTTYRDVLQEIIPTHAIAEAERRVYDRQEVIGYSCREGLCALGVMRYRQHNWTVEECPAFSTRHPLPSEFPGAYEDSSPTVRRRAAALRAIYRANDRGQFATPGSLSALLDTECRMVVS